MTAFTQTTNPFPTRPSFDELYDYIFAYARKMPKLCQNLFGTCYYRRGGNACLVGSLLTDAQATGIKILPWEKVAATMPEMFPAWMSEKDATNFLREVQMIHDTADRKGDMLDILASRRVELRGIYEGERSSVL